VFTVIELGTVLLVFLPGSVKYWAYSPIKSWSIWGWDLSHLTANVYNVAISLITRALYPMQKNRMWFNSHWSRCLAQVRELVLFKFLVSHCPQKEPSGISADATTDTYAADVHKLRRVPQALNSEN